MGAECNALAADLDRDPFMRDHVGLVRWGIRRHLAMYDDVSQADAAKVAITMAVRGHDARRGRFSTYLNGAFRWARLDAAKRFRRDVESSRWQLGGMDYDPPAVAHDPLAAAQTAELLAVLDPRSRDIVRRVVMLGEVRSAVARDYGISRERVRQIVVKALETMRACQA